MPFQEVADVNTGCGSLLIAQSENAFSFLSADRPTVVDAPPAYQEKDPAGVSKGLH